MRTVSTAGNNCLPEAIKLHMIRFSYVHSKRLHCKSYKQVKACLCSYCTELLNSDVVLRPNKAHAFLSFSTTSSFNDSCSILATVQVVVSHTWKPGLSWNRKGVLISRFQVHLYTSVIYGDRNSVLSIEVSFLGDSLFGRVPKYMVPCILVTHGCCNLASWHF